jgi:hypothetical protein
VHPRLEYALARELYATPEHRHFLLDTTVTATTPLIEAVPHEIEPAAWQTAIIALSRAITEAGTPIRHEYDMQPVVSILRANG